MIATNVTVEADGITVRLPDLPIDEMCSLAAFWIAILTASPTVP